MFRKTLLLIALLMSGVLLAGDDGISPDFPLDLDGNPITPLSSNVYWPEVFPNQAGNIWVYGMNDIPGSNLNGCSHLCDVLNANPANRAICYLNVPNTPYMPDFLHYRVGTHLTPDYQIYFNVHNLEPSYPCRTLDEYMEIVQDSSLLNRTRFVDFSDGQLKSLPGPPQSLQRYMSPEDNSALCSTCPKYSENFEAGFYTQKKTLKT